MLSIFVTMAALFVAQAPREGAPPRHDLTVALFPFTPDASTAAEAIEREFERQYPLIDLDIDLLDPYKIGLAHGEVFDHEYAALALRPFDIVEIDLCRLDDLRQYLDRLPQTHQNLGAPYGQPTSSAMQKASTAEYFVPHWECGNLVFTWTGSGMAEIDTFQEICDRTTGTAGSAVLADFYGGTTLGEFYADWLIDHYGADAAREKLRVLGARPVPKPTPEQEADKDWEANPLTKDDLDADAIKDFQAMVDELHPDLVKQLSRYHYASDVYPRRFHDGVERGSILIGYSERLYFVASERSLDPGFDLYGNEPPVRAEDLDVRGLAFGDQQQGTPVWVDGFVVPQGKFEAKSDAIVRFLEFMTSAQAYAIFRQPPGYGPAAHLLPCPLRESEPDVISDCPAIAECREALQTPVLLDESDIWRGIRYAGAILKDEVKAAAKARVLPAPPVGQ